MKRIIAGALLLTALAGQALALDAASIPPRFGVSWGASAGAAYIRSIPVTSQIGIINCAASLPDGFPPLTFVPASGGGCPPFGQDFNGILRQLSQWNQWQAAGGPVFYDATFSTAANGYPSGAILSSSILPGRHWMSTVDNNTTDPDAGGANWVQAPGEIPTGTPVQSLVATVPTGSVSANGTTIGNASSNATGRANADTIFLFTVVWNGCSNTICPILTSGGAGSTRGATPAADFAANKALTVWNMNGSALIGADSQNGSSSSNLVNVPVTSGSRTTPGSILGENLHVLLVGELAVHSHTDSGHTHSQITASFSGGAGSGVSACSGSCVAAVNGFFGGITASGAANITNTGSNTAHNTVPRSTATWWNLKL